MKNTRRHLFKLSMFLGMAAFLLLLIGGSMNTFSVAADNTGSSDKPAGTNDVPSVKIPPQVTDPAMIGKWEVQGSGGSTVDNSWADQPVPIHISLLPNGKLLFWGRDKRVGTDGEIYDDQGRTTARVWDPFYRTFQVANLEGPAGDLNSKTNLFCSGHSFLPDGRLFVSGGHNILLSHPLMEGMGSIHTNIYDYRTNTWTQGQDMNNGRWYPYNLTLGNGETLVAAGQYLQSATANPPRSFINEVPQIYSTQGTFRNVSILASTFPSTVINNYPLLHLLSNGKAFVAASASEIRSFALAPSPISGQGIWTHEDTLDIPHDRTTAVIYQKDKILVAGGAYADETRRESEIFDRDETTGIMRWRNTALMTYPRIYQTSIILPDGKVLVTGGTTCNGTNKINCSTGAANTPELFDPADESWRQMAPHQEPRAYHSTAILLPDARVLIGGGGQPAAEGEIAPNNNGQPCLSWHYQQPGNIPIPPSSPCRLYGHRNVEIFSPPYLFSTTNGVTTPATRPVIVSAPDELTYGQNFAVGVGTVSAPEIESAVLVRLGSVTHGFNQDQRRVPLDITAREGNTLSVNAPAGGNDCPPGPYMLFVMKRNGSNLTPSVAKIVRVNKISVPENTIALAGSWTLGGSQTITLPVTAAPTVSWSASVTSPGNFISITSPVGTVTGSRALTLNVAANGGDRRSGVLTINVSGEPVFNQVISIYQGKQYTDVPSDVQTPGKLNALAIASNCTLGSGFFCPNQTITRAELAEFFIKAIHGPGMPPPAAGPTPTFSDVPASHPLYAYIEDFYKRGFTNGCAAAPLSFCPNSTVSRAELAVFLSKALNINPPVRTTQTYRDVPPGFWAHSFIEEADARKLMGRCDVKTFVATSHIWFCPADNTTRKEVADALSAAFLF